VNQLIPKLAVTFAAFLAGTSLVAQLPSTALTTPPSWTLTTAFASQYMFRGTRLGGAAFQPSVEYDAGSLGLGLWTNVPLRDQVGGQSNPEGDFYGFYAVDLTKTTSLIPGFTVYTYPNAKEKNGFYRATVEPNLAMNYAIGGVRLTPKIYYDFVRRGPTLELTASMAVPLTSLGTELDFTGTAGTFIWKDADSDANSTVKNWGNYYLVGISAPYQVSKDSKVMVGWAYTKGSNNYFKAGTAGKTRNDAAIGRGVLTISYAISF
jgi:uncharacterized protein (TIGR02001 family)